MLSICIPVYDYNITSLINELRKQLESLNVSYEILVHNDASSIEIIDNDTIDSKIKLTITRSASKLGRHHSRVQLAKDATYNWILFLDADVAIPSPTFIQDYISVMKAGHPIVYGGVCYHKERPHNDMALRWYYGRAREKRSVARREMDAYQSIISMGFAIEKQLFLKIAGTITTTVYGQDILFSAFINKNKYPIKHIDNPVVHLGLEKNQAYLTKSLQAVDATAAFTKERLIPADFRPVQRAYLKLKRFKVVHVFVVLLSFLEPRLTKSLLKKPNNLMYLDLLKLYAYCKAKQG